MLKPLLFLCFICNTFTNIKDFKQQIQIATSKEKSTYSCEDLRLKAVDDFTNIKVLEFAPAYIDKKKHALAINAAKHKDVFAAATTSFTGKTGIYNLTINTLTEIDGESIYKVFINDILIGIFKNPSSTKDYAPASKTFTNISVKNNDSIRVEFNSHTNGHIPEGDSTAYSRGRWTSLDFNCNKKH